MNRVHEGVHHRGCILFVDSFFDVVEAGPSFPGKEKVCLLLLMEKAKELQNTLTIGQYLEENSYVPSQIAVELNERILSKAEYSTTVLHENDILEIVSFMGGGR